MSVRRSHTHLSAGGLAAGGREVPAPRRAPLVVPALGATFSDHMLICKYKNGKWGEAEIIPYQPLPMYPGTQVFHYGQSVFEGMKAFKTDDGKVLTFRVEDNFNRLNKSAKRICIPEIPKDIFKRLLLPN